jgi:hypothetical protein
MKSLVKKLLPVVDFLALPIVYPAAYVLKWLRQAGIQRMPQCRAALRRIGVFPIRDHYYEPFFQAAVPGVPRTLPGIEWNEPAQLELLAQCQFTEELRGVPLNKQKELEFFYFNPAFGPGDSEYLYNLLRIKRPRKLIEIGSGHSTLLAAKALAANAAQDASHVCEHVCIEPFEMPWLEQLGVKVIRKKVEEVGFDLFESLDSGDILFIDSSHMIRPGGDVLIEYLEILPRLKKGVIVHVHDIFSPDDYPENWISNEVKFWNEQYLLEAFLTCNGDWKIIGALNFLKNRHYDAFASRCLHLTADKQPGSFYMQRV